MIDAGSSIMTACRRLVTSSSETSLPPSMRVLIASASNCQTLPRSGHCARTDSTASRCAARLDERGLRAGVEQDPLHLLGAGRLVDGHDHGADREQRDVRERPLVPSLAHDRDPLAGLDTGGDEALGDGGDLVGERLGGDVHPGLAHASSQRWVVGPLDGVVENEVSGVVLGQRRDDAGNGQFAHSSRVLSWNLGLDARSARRSARSNGKPDAIPAASGDRRGRARVAWPLTAGAIGALPAGNLLAMPDESTQSIVIAAEPAAIMAVIADFANYPAWAGSVKRAEVARGRPGRARPPGRLRPGRRRGEGQVRADLHLGRRQRVEWTLVKGQMMRGQHGSYLLEPLDGGGTDVTYSLTVDLVIPMLGMLQAQGRAGHHGHRPQAAEEAGRDRGAGQRPDLR